LKIIIFETLSFSNPQPLNCVPHTLLLGHCTHQDYVSESLQSWQTELQAFWNTILAAGILVHGYHSCQDTIHK